MSLQSILARIRKDKEDLNFGKTKRGLL